MGFLSSLFGVKDRTPATTTNVVQQKIPPELAPYIKEISSEAKKLYQADIERGYDPYSGERIAGFTPEEETAMTGLTGVVGQTKPFLEEALTTYREGAEKFTPEVAQEYMSPYQRAVTDIEKREAERSFDRASQAREARAVEAGAGSLMGSRAAIEASEAQRNLQTQLGNIESRGLQQAFQNAQQQFAAQKAREASTAQNVARTGAATTQADIADMGVLQQIGEQKRDLAQSTLDEAYGKFLEERAFPSQTLADYSTTIYGNPYARGPSYAQTTSELPGAPSMGQQLLGLGMTGLNIYGAGTAGGTSPFNWGAAGKGMLNMPKRTGGRMSGLSGLPVIQRQTNGVIYDPERGDEDWSNYDWSSVYGTPTNDNPVVTVPSLTDKVTSGSIKEELITNPDLDPAKVEQSTAKSISELQNIFGQSRKGEEESKRKYFERRRELMDEQDYPFANIQSAIAAGMDEPTIAMMLIKGSAKAGELTKKDKKEIKKVEVELLKEEFGVEREDQSKNEKRALTIFERNASLRERLLKLPSELRDRVLNRITKLKGIQVKDAQIAKLLAEAEAELNKAPIGYKEGISPTELPGLLQTISIGEGTNQRSIMEAGKEGLSPRDRAIRAEAEDIIDKAAMNLIKTHPKAEYGLVSAVQQKALRSPAAKARFQAIFDKYANPSTGGDGTNNKQQVTKKPTATNIIKKQQTNARQKILNRFGPISNSPSFR